MSQKNQIYALAATSIALAGTTAFLAYKAYSTKSELVSWYKAQEPGVRSSLPASIKEMLDKATA